jgi:NADPH:quinone reductase-like Zn-dependent oxidoreductase
MVQVVVASAYGSPEVLEIVDRELQAPDPGEVWIDVKAAGVNPADYKFYSGAFGADESALPMPLGMEVSGVVAAVGADPQGISGPLAIGDEVIAFQVRGGYAERIVATAADVIAKPAGLSFEEAAGLLAAGSTAAHLVAATALAAGDTVLIHGAAGGVGLLVTQLAILKGASVIGTASAGRHDTLRHYGAIPVEYGPGLADRVRELATGGVDAAMDLVGSDEAIDVSLALVAPQDRIATIAGFGKTTGTEIKVLGAGAPGADPGTEIRAASRAELVRLADEGRLELVVDRTFPLEGAAEAHRYLQHGHAAGKVVLLP